MAEVLGCFAMAVAALMFALGYQVWLELRTPHVPRDRPFNVNDPPYVPWLGEKDLY